MARRRLVLACAVGIATLGVAAGPAQAHSELTSSTPAANAVLAEAPASLQLEFSDAIKAQFSRLSLSVATGSARTVPVTVSGRRMTALVPAGAAGPGKWTVAFRVVSVDGHPISGTIAFTVRPAAATRTPTPTTGARTSPAAVTSAAPAESRADPLLPRRRLIYWVEGIVGAMLLLAAGVYFARDRS